MYHIFCRPIRNNKTMEIQLEGEGVVVVIVFIVYNATPR